MSEKVGQIQVEQGEVSPKQMGEIETGEYLTVTEIANKLRYSRPWVLGLLKANRIHGIKPLGGRWRIPRSEFDRILKEGVPPMPREEKEKPPVTTIEVSDKVVDKIKEPEKKEKRPSSTWPLDFTGLFGGDK